MEIQTEPNRHNELILKSNMWKFIKRLHAQEQPIYSLFSKSPGTTVWIDIIHEETEYPELSFSDFITSLNKLPGSPARYRLHFKIYFPKDEKSNEEDASGPVFTGEQLFTATYREELAVEVIKQEFPHFLAYLCKKAISNNRIFQLTPATIKYYGISNKYVDSLKNKSPYATVESLPNLKANLESLNKKGKTKNNIREKTLPL